MKWAILIMGFLPAAVLPAVDEWVIVPVKPSFTWQKDEENVPTERDPMTPVDFIWPRPAKATNAAPVKSNKNKVQLSLKVEFISVTETERFAKVTGFAEFLEEGKEYSFTAKGYKVVFKVQRIEPAKIVVNYEGDLIEFQPKTIPEQLDNRGF